MLSKRYLTTAIDRRHARWSEYGNLRYLHFLDDYQSIPRGTVVFDDAIVYGYPAMGRIVALQSGLRQQFREPFWLEEKVNGYNVRIARVNDRVLALSRGGYICPFTTDRLPDLLDTRLFDHEPELVLCAEVAGPGNPYLESHPPFIEEDVQLFVFDMMRCNQRELLHQSEKNRLIDHYRLPSVTRFGHFTHTDTDAIGGIVLKLNAQHREGVTFKENPPGGKRAKYVTAASCISDIRATAAFLEELPADYFTSRILRLSLFLKEHGLATQGDPAARLGAAILDGLADAGRLFDDTHKVYHRFRCRFRQRDNALSFIDHLQRAGGHKVQINLHDLRQEQTYWLLEFDRIFPKTTGQFNHLLRGALLFD